MPGVHIRSHCHSNPLYAFLISERNCPFYYAIFTLITLISPKTDYILTFLRNISTRENSNTQKLISRSVDLFAFWFLFQFNVGSAPPASPTTENDWTARKRFIMRKGPVNRCPRLCLLSTDVLLHLLWGIVAYTINLPLKIKLSYDTN